VLCRFLTSIISKVQILYLFIINGSKHVQTYTVCKVVIKILQGSAVTQTALGGLPIVPSQILKVFPYTIFDENTLVCGHLDF